MFQTKIPNQSEKNEGAMNENITSVNDELMRDSSSNGTFLAEQKLQTSNFGVVVVVVVVVSHSLFVLHCTFSSQLFIWSLLSTKHL